MAIFWNEPDCSDHFTYDTTWGGLITTNAMDDGGADFGQGHISQIISLVSNTFKFKKSGFFVQTRKFTTEVYTIITLAACSANRTQAELKTGLVRNNEA